MNKLVNLISAAKNAEWKTEKLLSLQTRNIKKKKRASKSFVIIDLWTVKNHLIENITHDNQSYNHYNNGGKRQSNLVNDYVCTKLKFTKLITGNIILFMRESKMNTVGFM